MQQAIQLGMRKTFSPVHSLIYIGDKAANRCHWPINSTTWIAHDFNGRTVGHKTCEDDASARGRDRKNTNPFHRRVEYIIVSANGAR